MGIRDMYIERQMKNAEQLIGVTTDTEDFDIKAAEYIDSSKEITKLAPYAKNLIEYMKLGFKHLRSEVKALGEYFVYYNYNTYVVQFNLGSVECNCNFTKYTKFVCSHILYVCLKHDLDAYKFISSEYSLHSLARTYLTRYTPIIFDISEAVSSVNEYEAGTAKRGLIKRKRLNKNETNRIEMLKHIRIAPDTIEEN